MSKLTFHVSDEYALPLGIVTERVAWLGQSGSGKTYAAMKLAEEMLRRGAQVVALDPANVWWGLRAGADGKSAGFPINVFGGEHGDIALTPESGRLVAEAIVEKEISAVLDVADFTLGERAQFSIGFAEAFFRAKKKKKGPVHMFIEEAHNFLPQNIPSAEAKGDPKKSPAVMLNRFELLARQGRGYGLGMSMITQMPQSVNKHALNQCGTVFAMRTMGTHERKAITAWVADKATEDGQLNLADRLPTLNTGDAWVASPHFLKVFRQIHFKKKETFDSSRTPEFGETFHEPKVLAPVDVEALRSAMATVIEQAEKDDPAKLHARIRQLEAEVKKKLGTAAPAAPRVETKVETKTVEVPVVREKDVKRLEAVAARLVDSQAVVAEALKAMATAISGARVVAVPSTSTRTDLKVEERAPRESRADLARPPGLTPAPIAGAGGQPKGERAVLIAVAQHEDGVTKTQLGVLTGYKISTRNSYIQRLREQQLVHVDGEHVRVTTEGLAALGPSFTPLPTGDELLAHWRSRLPSGELAVLDVLAAAYPGAVDKEKIDEATGYARSSRNSYLQRLRARRLIEEVGAEQVRASPHLFSNGKAA